MPLILCGMPIGNPEDISPRVLRTLQNTDLIAAEDTRSAALFLQAHNLGKELLSFYDHNEKERVPQILELLRQGKTIAVISEAGMPLISDPGYHLVNAAQKENIAIDVIPGPTALITALAASGLPTDRFAFEGFLPAKTAARQKTLRELSSETRTLIFYEAPHRIQETLQDIAEIFPERQCFAGRELTKKYQEYLHGTAQEILAQLKTPKGEFVIVLSGSKKTTAAEIPNEIQELAKQLLAANLSVSKTAGIISTVFDWPKNQLKKLLMPESNT
ncbi:rRNA small subunit methyltransferase I [Candidatus Termititenax dinenymphae]|uniref:Ribosomal RNA small subunit methyltransferase I n=1 Tax=Candidatus Termititenax dinenymphae TaxID=2218523 RepID=A0A388TLH9_9BACT|nr:rRNA small subunit methyltransferase I [Candidatus Termititenax dinenymphae]